MPFACCKRSHEVVLLLEGLELTMSDLGGSIDELDIKLEVVERLGWLEERLSNGDLSLSWSHNVSSEKQEVLVDDTVVWESSNWGDVLLCWIVLSLGVVADSADGTLSDSEDLLVDLSSVEVTQVTGSSDSPLNGRWMPSTDTGNLSETSMGLSWESADSESLDDTGGSLTSGDGNGINRLVHFEDLVDGDFLLEVLSGPLDLIGNGSSVNLDLQEMSLLLSEFHLLDLGAAENSDNLAVLSDSVDISINWLLSILGLVFLGVVGESLLLGSVVVLVESSLESLWQVLSPDSAESSKASWGFNVADHSDDLDWWGLNDGDWLDNILLDGLLTFSLLQVPDAV